ncbi:MAG: UDP-glucose/GDP-mannose dehydrogenase family protein [Candidatus Omnitrophica bacterium]|nr:UDP-glucose/GDP-mannose dehydrogenase family protein [Candidatus Omnitrophota bacterium]
MKISVIGSGYVGLVTGACFAELGNTVICVDNDKTKVKKLKSGIMPIYEPGLSELVRRNVRKGRLFFTTDIKEAVRKSEIIFIAVGTPPRDNGEADLSSVEHVSREIALSMTSYKLVIEKSTVPVNTGEWVERTIKIFNKRRVKFDVASNPEFLREGTAIEDFMNPDRVVLGVSSKKAADILRTLYGPLNAPILVTDIKSAEIIKHAANSFLAMKISFINAISNICDRLNADVAEVAKGIGLDKRIGDKFLNAGLGFGGFCFPKDLAAFIRISEKAGYDFGLLKEVEKINESQKLALIRKIEGITWNLPGKTVGILGLSFKPDTDDLRYAPALDIITMLRQQGVKIKVYDPIAMGKARRILKKSVKFCRDAYDTVKDCDCLVIATEWSEFKELDLKKVKRLMKQPAMVDGRNIYEPAEVKKLGFTYTGMGRR